MRSISNISEKVNLSLLSKRDRSQRSASLIMDSDSALVASVPIVIFIIYIRIKYFWCRAGKVSELMHSNHHAFCHNRSHERLQLLASQCALRAAISSVIRPGSHTHRGPPEHCQPPALARTRTRGSTTRRYASFLRASG